MQRIDGADVSGVFPAPAATVAPGWFTEGDPGAGVPATVVTADWLNMVQEELCGAAIVRGAALSKTSVNQIASILMHALAFNSHPGGAVAGSITPYKRAVVASGTSGNGFDDGATVAAHVASDACSVGATAERAAFLAAHSSAIESGSLDAAVIASDGGHTTGHRAAVIASYIAKVSGFQSAALAAGKVGNAALDDVGGDNAAYIASYDGSGGGGLVINGDRSAVVGCDRGETWASASESLVGGSKQSIVKAPRSAIIGSTNSLVEGGSASENGLLGAAYSIARNGNQTGIVGSYDSAIETATRAAILGSNNGIVNVGECGVLVASYRARLGTDYSLAGGYGGSAVSGTGADTNLKWRLSSSLGNLYIDGSNNAGAADYAEAFENVAPGEIGPGLLVTRQGRRVRLAGVGDRVLGPVSGRPAIVGNAAPLSWAGKYARDAWGRPVMHAVEHVRWPAAFAAFAMITTPAVPGVPATDDAPAVPAVPEGVLYEGPVTDAPETPAGGRRKEYTARVREAFRGPSATSPTPWPADAETYTVDLPTEAAGYDPEKAYTPRTERPDEWTVVGLLGQLPIRVAEGVAEGDDLAAGPNGIGVTAFGATPGGARIEVMEIAVPFDAVAGYAVALCLVR